MEFPRRLHVETDGTQFEGHWLQGPSPLFCQPRYLRVRLGPRGDPAGIGRKLGHQLSTSHASASAISLHERRLTRLGGARVASLVETITDGVG